MDPDFHERRITLLRHAQAVHDAADDHDRALDADGEREAPRAGRRLRARGLRPTLIVTSSARRARQTARLVARELGYPMEFLQREDALYLATPGGILAVLERQDDACRDIVVCGHNPGLTELARILTGQVLDEMPTCGMVSIGVPAPRWADLTGATGRLLYVDYPL